MHLRRISTLAIFMIVCLRLTIGWQLFYEGLWKVKTLSGPQPWTSVGYLKNSQGPLRGVFRSMTGDPDDLAWLDVDQMTDKWKQWSLRFARHYRLDGRQDARLRNLVEGPSAFYSDVGKLESIPESVDLSAVKGLTYDAEKKRLVVDGKRHLSPGEYQKILRMLPTGATPSADMSDEERVFREQLERVYLRASRLSYLEKLRANLVGNPEVAGMRDREGETQQIGGREKYELMLADYEAAVASARQAFQYEHLKKMAADLREQRAALVNPIKALESEMKEEAEKLLTVQQMRAGAVPEPWTALRIADTLTILGLAATGFCLITGLFTRFAAVMAAIMLFSFYLAMPPLPGLPETPGPEHSLIVNKNLIEVVALLAIAAVPSGYWFGLDRLVGRVFHRRHSDH